MVELTSPDPSSGGAPLARLSARTIAGLVFIATMMMTLVDFQFKDLARAAYPDGTEALVRFSRLIRPGTCSSSTFASALCR